MGWLDEEWEAASRQIQALEPFGCSPTWSGIPTTAE
jgi:hypothetical protein